MSTATESAETRLARIMKEREIWIASQIEQFGKVKTAEDKMVDKLNETYAPTPKTTTAVVTCGKCSKEFKRESGLVWHQRNFKSCGVKVTSNVTVDNVSGEIEILPEIDPRLLSKKGKPLAGAVLANRIAKIAEQDAKPSKKIKVTADNGSHELSQDGGPDNVELDASVRNHWANRYEQIEKELKHLGEYSDLQDSMQNLFEKQQQIDSDAIAQLQIEVARLKDENATHCQLQQSSSETIEQVQVEIYNIQEELAQRFRNDHVTVDSDNSKLAAQVERLIGEQHAISDALRSLIPNETS